MLLQEDRSRNDDAELKAMESNTQSETRIAELEAKLSDLSESVGNYERLRYQDQQTIQVLSHTDHCHLIELYSKTSCNNYCKKRAMPVCQALFQVFSVSINQTIQCKQISGRKQFY